MKINSVSLGGSVSNQDRYFVTGKADGIVLVVLDGATAFEPDQLDAGVYAEFLGDHIANRLDGAPEVAISEAVANAISCTAEQLHLSPGKSPSSTVSVLRTRPGAIDLYVLGDSPIHYGTDNTHQVWTDGRLDSIGQEERSRYQDRLRAGYGFDDEHKRILRALQRAQRQQRNTPGGYWIAEADPAAAYAGLTTTLPADSVAWAVLATDGAGDILDHLATDWAALATLDVTDLPALLQGLHAWEESEDPNGSQLPRAKRHDDKTLVVTAL